MKTFGSILSDRFATAAAPARASGKTRNARPYGNSLLLGALLSAATATAAFADGQVTIIHTGDFHGHLTPRPNLRSNADYPGQMVGGLARVAAKIKEIQAGKGGAGNTLLMHTGDTIQGSGEVLYTRGQAIVDVVDMLGVNAYAPGNWDFVYGPERFKELFAAQLNSRIPEHAKGKAVPPPAGTRWGGLVSNVYLTNPNPSAPKRPTAMGSAQDSNVSASEYDTWADWYVDNGQRVLPPYTIKTVNGVKVGIVGCTTSRGPQVVGSWVTTGLEFTDCAREVPRFAEAARNDGAEIVVLISEIEIGRNIDILKQNITKPEQHVDLVLNSDMHEEVLKPIEVASPVDPNKKTWIIESGQDGTLVGEVALSVHAGQVVDMKHTPHRIDDRIAEDTAVASKVAQVRHPFNEGFNASVPCDANSPYWNTFTQATCLNGPLSEVVGSTEVALHRSNFSHEDMAATIEGSSHDFVTDAIRWWAKSDLATVRGFRYGTHVAPGPITRNDLFHFVPIGPRVGKASRIVPNQIRNQIDNSSLAVLSSEPNSPIIPLPRYNNAYGTNGQDPGAGLTKYGLGGSPMGFGGGWLFAYSGEGFHMDFAPYFVPSAQVVKSGAPGSNGSGIYLDIDPVTGKPYNIQVAAAATDTSRARSLTLKVPCKYLPPTEQASNGCSVADTVTRFQTTLTTQADGKWTSSWNTPFTTAKQVYLLNPEGWQYLQGLANQPNQPNAAARPFQMPSFTVAGYWYRQSPDTINNCNNCYAAGTSTVVGDPNAAYLLPVNVGQDGNAALDADGNPIFVRDSNGNVEWETDYNNKPKPKIAGAAIDLTLIIEKYLAHLEAEDGGVTSDNLPLNRIGLVNNNGTGPISMPDFSGTLGFPVMQPFCGTLGKDATSTLACPQ
jgi:2',3'-cyclic-nucleotide 2'-phosphodiesterase (5'-nucleotidase family)